MQFVLTDAGQLIIQGNPGVAPDLQSFKLGSGVGYTPSPGQTDLVGLEVHTGIPSNPVVQASNLIKYTLFLDFSLGNFNFGEVALYAPGNVLFAIGTSTTQIPKVKSEINVDGNSLSIDCYVSTSGTTYSIYAELGNSDVNINIPAVSGIDVLPPAYLAIPNTYQLSSPGQLSSVLAFSNNSRWSVTGYDTEIHQALTVISGSTASSIRFAETATNPTTPGELLIQGVTGLNAGSIRIVAGYSAGTNAYSVNTSFLYQPQIGDLFSIVRRNYLTPTAVGFLNGLNPGVGAGQTNGLQSIDLNKIFMTDGSRPAINNWDVANYRITNVGNPIYGGDAINKQWLDAAIVNYNDTTVTPIANAPKVQIGLGAPIGTVPTNPPFYADKTIPGRYDLYINDPSTSNWTLVYPTDSQYGVGVPVLGTTPTTPNLYYDTSVSTRYIPYVFRSGDWHRIGYTDPGINFTGGVTITDSLAVGVSSPNPLNMTGGGFQTSNTLGINFDMKSVGLNSTLRNRWPSTYAFTLNTSNNETGAYELCRNNTAVGGMRIIEDGSIYVGSKGLTSFYLIYNNAPVAAVSTGFFDIFPTYNAGGLLRVNSRYSVISGVPIGSKGATSNNIFIGDGGSGITATATYNVGTGYGVFSALTTGSNNVAIGTSAAQAITTGNANTAVGASSLLSTTSGSSNVAVGDSCLSSSIVASQRTAVGSGANSTASSTVTLGYQAYGAATGQVSIGARAKGGTGADNIAIGTTSMESATTADYSIGIGMDTLKVSAGISNIAIGHSTLRSNTTGTRNVAVGTQVSTISTSASDNTFIGSSVGSATTTGGLNVGVGSQSLASNTTGGYNTAIGSYSSTNTSTGQQNTAVGSYSLYSNTTGAVNCAFGYESLYSNSTGGANTSVGDRALRSNTTGIQNVAIGGSSLISNVAGAYNVAIGTLALNKNSTGNTNIGIGDSALYWNTTGSGLIAIGSSALTTLNSSLAIPSNSTVIGTSAGFALAYTVNQVLIGNNVLSGAASSVNSVCIGAYAAEAAANVRDDVYIGAEAGRNVSGTFTGVTTQSVYIGYRSSHSRSTTQFFGSNNVGVGAKTFETADAVFSVALGYGAGSKGNHNGTVCIGNASDFKTGSYTDSNLIGTDCLSASSVGNISTSTLIGAKCFGGHIVNNITKSILIGDSLYNTVPTTINFNNVILLGGTASSSSASNEVTIGSLSHTVYRMGATDWTYISDRRDKTNIVPLTEGLDIINKLNPVRFEWNSRDGAKCGVEESGFIAQELQDALGESNSYLRIVNDSNPDQLAINRAGINTLMVKAIQELSTENNQLKLSLQQLREDLDSLLNR